MELAVKRARKGPQFAEYFHFLMVYNYKSQTEKPLP